MKKPGEFKSMREANEWLKAEGSRQRKIDRGFDEQMDQLTKSMEAVTKAHETARAQADEWLTTPIMRQSSDTTGIVATTSSGLNIPRFASGSSSTARPTISP